MNPNNIEFFDLMLKQREKKLNQDDFRLHYEQKELERLQIIFNTLPIGIVIADNDGNVLSYNKHFNWALNMNKDEDIKGQNIYELLTIKNDASIIKLAKETLGRNNPFSIMGAKLSVSADSKILDINFTPIITDDSKNVGSIVTILDQTIVYKANERLNTEIAKRKEAEEKLKNLAHFDMLTNLPNRFLFYDRLQNSLNQNERRKTIVIIMYIDLDGFKKVNDTYGHKAGDLLLMEMAERMKECLRKGDTVARIGGDEFTIIMPDIKKVSDANIVAQRILRIIAKPVNISDNEVVISASIGISIYPDDGIMTDELVNKADSAMYAAKKLGKNNYQFYYKLKDQNNDSD